MKLNRSLLITISFLCFACSVTALAAYEVRDQNERAEYYRDQDERAARGEPTFAGQYCFPDTHPRTLLMISAFSGLAFLASLLTKNPFGPFTFSLITWTIYPLWYMSTQRLIEGNETVPPAVLDRYLYRAGVFDLVAFGLLSISVLLHFRCVANGFRKFLDKRKPLP